MKPMLGIDLVGDRLCAVELIGGRKPQIRSAWTARLPETLRLAHADKLGIWLKRQIEENGMRATEVGVLLGKPTVVSQLLRLPACPDAELPALLAFEVQQETALTSGSVLDFQAEASLGEDRPVFAAQADEDALRACTVMASQAGLACRFVGYRPFACWQFWRSQTTELAETGALFLLPEVDSVDLSVWEGRQLLLHRTISLLPDRAEPRWIIAEVRRTLGAIAAQHPNLSVERLVVAGHGNQQILDELRPLQMGSCEHFEPSSVIAGHETAPSASFAALSAAWCAAHSRSLPINFLQPKRASAARPTVSRPRLAAAAAIVVASLLAAWAGWSIVERNRTINRLTTEFDRLKQEVAVAEPVLERHKAIKGWLDAGVPWLSELEELAASFPETDDAFLSDLELLRNQRGKASSMRLRGRAKSAQVVLNLQNRWAADADKRMEVDPHTIEPMQDLPEFGWRFAVDLSIRPLDDKQYAVRAEERSKKPAPVVTSGKQRVNASLAVAKSGKNATPAAPTPGAPTPMPAGVLAMPPPEMPAAPPSAPTGVRPVSPGDVIERRVVPQSVPASVPVTFPAEAKVQ